MKKAVFPDIHQTWLGMRVSSDLSPREKEARERPEERATRPGKRGVEHET